MRCLTCKACCYKEEQSLLPLNHRTSLFDGNGMEVGMRAWGCVGGRRLVPLCCAIGCACYIVFSSINTMSREIERLNHAIQRCLQLTCSEHINIPSLLMNNISINTSMLSHSLSNCHQFTLSSLSLQRWIAPKITLLIGEDDHEMHLLN